MEIYKTRSGKDAVITHQNHSDSVFPVIGHIVVDEDLRIPAAWWFNGLCLLFGRVDDDAIKHDYDITETPFREKYYND